MNSSQNYTFKFQEEDIKRNKWLSVISYIGFLFIIPLFLKKESKYARFHANQGLALFIVEVIMALVYYFLSMIAGLFGLAMMMVGVNFVMSVILIVLISLMLMGVINASGGLAKSLPFIGGIEILK